MELQVNLQQLDERCQEVFDDLEKQNQLTRKMKRKVNRQQRIKLEPGTRRSIKRQEPELPSWKTSYVNKLCNELQLRGLLEPVLTGDLRTILTWPQYTSLERAIIHVIYARELFERVHEAIELVASNWPINLERELELLWDNASYHLYGNSSRHSNKTPADEKAQSDMRAVRQYRIRLRYPCPTLKLRGKKRYSISQAANNLLQQVFIQNQRPDKAVRGDISAKTGLTFETISNWFKNRRARVKETNGKALEEAACSLSSDEPATPSSIASSSLSPSSYTNDLLLIPSEELMEDPFLTQDIMFEFMFPY